MRRAAGGAAGPAAWRGGAGTGPEVAEGLQGHCVGELELSCSVLPSHDISRHISTYHNISCPALPFPALPGCVPGGHTGRQHASSWCLRHKGSEILVPSSNIIYIISPLW